MSTIVLKKTIEEGAEHGHRDDRRLVELADRVGRVLADALEVEDDLGEDRAAADHERRSRGPRG